MANERGRKRKRRKLEKVERDAKGKSGERKRKKGRMNIVKENTLVNTYEHFLSLPSSSVSVANV